MYVQQGNDSYFYTMRQLDLFGFDSEPQQDAPPQKKTVTVLRATSLPPDVSDNATLVFADNQIGIKIKLKREVPLTDDTTSINVLPKTGETEPVQEKEDPETTLLQQLTIEDAILEVIKETAAEPDPEEPVADTLAEITITAEMEEAAGDEPVADSAEETQIVVSVATIPAAPVAAQQWLVKPTIISIEEEIIPELQEPEPEAVAEEPAVEAEEPHQEEEELPAVPTAEEQPVAPPVAAVRQFLTRPAVIEIEEEETPVHAEKEEPATIEAEPPVAVITEEAVPELKLPEADTQKEETTTVPEAEAVQIQEEEQARDAEPEPVEQEEVQIPEPETQPEMVLAPPPPAKIKAPRPAKEPAAPKKRGRKSFKEIDAETDLIQLPDDDALFEKQYYPISVVAGWFNVNASLLRFWENEFDILKPRKNRKGDRLFRPEDVKNLQVIYYLLRQRKFTIEGAKEYLKTNKKKADTNTQLIQSLTKLRGFLLEFKANLDH